MSPTLSRRACLLAAAFALSCRSSNPSRPGDGQRIVSLTPNTTETVYALGAGNRMVGRSRYCDYPAEVHQLPSVGGYVDPSLEAILALQPTLVIDARGPIGRSLVDKLEAREIQCFFPPTESVEQILAMISGLAEHLDTPQAAIHLTTSIRERLHHLQLQVQPLSSPRTLLVFGQSPISVAGPGSFPDEMLRLAGCKNAVERGSHYPTLGFETVIGLDPDLIIDATMAAERSTTPIHAQKAGWSSVRAVREGNVVRLGDDRILRPGPRLADGVALLARHAHKGVSIP